MLNLTLKFESDVISDGTQTPYIGIGRIHLFESDVISDGTQTFLHFFFHDFQFESDVISDGTQTPSLSLYVAH